MCNSKSRLEPHSLTIQQNLSHAYIQLTPTEFVPHKGAGKTQYQRQRFSVLPCSPAHLPEMATTFTTESTELYKDLATEGLSNGSSILKRRSGVNGLPGRPRVPIKGTELMKALRKAHLLPDLDRVKPYLWLVSLLLFHSSSKPKN